MPRRTTVAGGMRPVLVVVAGVLIGVLAVLGIAALTNDDDADPAGGGDPIELSFASVESDPAAAEALVVAWNRWRTASFVTTGTWTRTLDADPDNPLSGDVFTAQDPPRRLVVRLGAVLESIDGTVTTCDAPSEDVIVPACIDGGGGRAYDDRVAAEMQLVLGYVIGDARLYDVGFGSADNPLVTCFDVELREAVLRSPWGRAGAFCFHDDTGALASSRVRRQSAVDEEVTLSYRTEVTDADFLD